MCKSRAPSHNKTATPPDEPCSWSRSTWSCSAPPRTAAPLVGCFLILVTLCCRHAQCASQTPSHTRWSHFRPLENSDAISIIVLRWEMNGPGLTKVQFSALPAYKSFGRRFCNTKRLVFSPVKFPCGKGLLWGMTPEECWRGVRHVIKFQPCYFPAVTLGKPIFPSDILSTKR